MPSVIMGSRKLPTLQTDFPSWLYQITKGATTVWEHWDEIKTDGSFWSPDMNSFNHYAYGSIGSWLYQTVCGIEIDEKRPAYKKILFRPLLSKSFQWAKASHESSYGTVGLSWEFSPNGFLVIRIQVPHNTEGDILLPYTRGEDIALNGRPVKMENLFAGARMTVGSSKWEFCYPLRQNRG